jgi:hypothetical protein
VFSLSLEIYINQIKPNHPSAVYFYPPARKAPKGPFI